MVIEMKEIFENPPAKFRGVPFWSWNCKVTRELIDSQLECFKEMGFGGVDIHSRTGLDTPYLGEEYMELVAYAVAKCKELGLYCWLYDEDRFPSGNAGGIVTMENKYRGRYLILTNVQIGHEKLAGFSKDRGQFSHEIESGNEPQGYYVTSYEIKLNNGYLENYRRLNTEDEIKKSLEEGADVWAAYVKMMPTDHWFENKSYVDTMNPKAIHRFIEVTHEAYRASVGDEFGKTIPAIFTDEPRIGKHTQTDTAMSKEDITIPYTDYFAEQMIKNTGINPLDIVPEYVWELPNNVKSENRYLYRKMTTECFANAYMDNIAAWCNANNIAMTGHVLSEDTLSGQSVTVGDCMRCYRDMDMPGIDILLDSREFTTVKQAVSVARQGGKKDVVSELYGVTHWDCDFATYKMQGDWQAALGVTVRVPHLSYMSMKGEAKRDWPASIFYQSPWYKEFPYIENHFARINSVLTRGQAVVKIAMIHPVESCWLYFGPSNQTEEKRKEMDNNFRSITEWLLYDTLDFDFLAESLLQEQCENIWQEDKSLHVGCMKYEAILVPDMKTIRSTTLDILEAYKNRGGKIIFIGDIPDYVDAKPSDRAIRLADKCVCVPFKRASILEVLQDMHMVEIRDARSRKTENLLYQMRQEGDTKWLYICHANRKYNHLSQAEQYEIKIWGTYKATLYNTINGGITPVLVETENGYTTIKCFIYAEDSLLYKLEPTTEMSNSKNVKEKAPKYEIIQKLFIPEKVKRSEPNVLLLDYAEVQLDDGKIQPREEILRADNHIREKLGFAIRQERMNQPWFMEEKETHKVRILYTFEAKASLPVSIGLEDIENSKVYLNEKPVEMTTAGYYVDKAISVIPMPNVQIGTNHLTVEVEYNQKSGLENVYLLGDFDMELKGQNATIIPNQNTKCLGDITRLGMPFYTGNLDYIFTFTIDKDNEYFVHIPYFKAPVISINLDGGDKGLIALSPHMLSLGYLKQGTHTMTVRLYGNRFNGFGTLHNANENFIWYGPDSYRTQGDDWTDLYELRRVGILDGVNIVAKFRE